MLQPLTNKQKLHITELLVTKLMGWEKSGPYWVSREDRLIRYPAHDAAHCRLCEERIRERGLAGPYIDALRELASEYGEDEALVYADAEKRCVAMLLAMGMKLEDILATGNAKE